MEMYLKDAIADSHSHNVDEDYIKKINENDLVGLVILAGMDMETSLDAIQTASENDKFFVCVGFHPCHLHGENISELIPFLDNKKVVGIGETGLDLPPKNSNLREQREFLNNYDEQVSYLIQHIKLANDYGLPLVIHANNANEEVIKIFNTYGKPEHGCMFHCFQPDLKVLEYLIENGIYVSFGGRVTRENASKSLEVIKSVPDNLFLVETDCPYVNIGPKGEIVSSAENIVYIIQRIAQVKEKSESYIRRRTWQNTLDLFKKIR